MGRGNSDANKMKMLEYLAIKNDGQVRIATPGRVEKKETRGRKVRANRPTRAAAKHTNPGEERYLITLETEQIEAMRGMATFLGIPIKTLYQRCVSDFLDQHLASK